MAPRTVCATVQSSSGVDLTAAVLLDAVTNEIMLEGGGTCLQTWALRVMTSLTK
jgi:DNA replicative helicase MCM subunit Mcm2 (Cdc46/Mcm family)